MTDSKRLTVLKVISDHLLDTIKVSNGYKHDLQAVSRGRLFLGETDPLPGVSILEDLDPDRDPKTAGIERTKHYEMWTLLMQGFVADDFDNPCDPAYELMADVKKALALALDEDAGSLYLFGGLINGMSIEPGTVRPPSEVSSRAFFWMRVILKFVEHVDDPYRL